MESFETVNVIQGFNVVEVMEHLELTNEQAYIIPFENRMYFSQFLAVHCKFYNLMSLADAAEQM